MLATQRVSLLVLTLLLATLFIFLISREDRLPTAHLPVVTFQHQSPPKPTVADSLASLFDSIRHPITKPYTDASGKTYHIDKPIWTEPLKKNILLVDIDTREPTGDNQVFNNDTIRWEELGVHGGQLVSNAIMTHYLYAQIHGYDYKFIQASHIPSHHDTWISPHVLRTYTPSYAFVVTMDADVTISHLEVPLEFLFNKWHITPNTSIGMPWDQEEVRGSDKISVDSKGRQVLNTGLMVVQNMPYTLEMLEAWRDCTTERRYAGCGRWREEWSHEQRAFSEYVRYDFNRSADAIVGIPCDDAMGWPNMLKDYSGRLTSDCNGNFFRHHTLKKEMTKESASLAVMQSLTQILQLELLRQKEEVYVNESAAAEVELVEGGEGGEDEENDEKIVLGGLSAR